MHHPATLRYNSTKNSLALFRHLNPYPVETRLPFHVGKYHRSTRGATIAFCASRKNRSIPLGFSHHVATPDISIIVPTINEAANLPALAQRIHRAMAGRSYELLIIDDASTDNTAQVCAALAEQYPIRLMVREDPKDGLSGAVLTGLGAAGGEVFVVMDADLQHPPEKLPELIDAVQQNLGDFAIGSRHVPGGSVEGGWGLVRRINSRVATILARPFAGKISDPMSGFFALPRSTYQRAQRLTPLGYKIALELMSKCRVQKVHEVPIHFGLRQHGESKLTIKQQFRYLEHLSRLYDFSFPRLAPILKFLIVLAGCWIIGFLVDGALIGSGVKIVPAITIAYLSAIAVTTLFHIRYVRTQREFLLHLQPWRDFIFISICEWIACILAAIWAQHELARPEWAGIFVIAFAVAMIVRYILRKELLQDIRGLRKDTRTEEIGHR